MSSLRDDGAMLPASGGPLPEKDILCCASGLEGEKLMAATSGPVSLEKVYLQAQSAGLAKEYTSLAELPADEVEIRGEPKPAGHRSQTLLYFGGKAVVALCDYCATCSALPEEILMFILADAVKQVEAGLIDPGDRTYPITRIERYVAPTTVVGIAEAKP